MIKKFPENFNWKGGSKHSCGYVVIYMPNHPFSKSQGRIYEHRLVMEKHLGRYLKKGETIHHINGIKNDNRIENLQLFNNNSEHMRHEALTPNKNSVKTRFKKGQKAPAHKNLCPCPRCDKSKLKSFSFQKGNVPPPHKIGCKCFRCTRIPINHKKSIL